jgi:alkylated DNA repair dioxygenase AlkB
MKGINLVLNFISDEEEAELIHNISPTKKRKGIGRSSIQRYGTPVYSNNVVSKTIPEWLYKYNTKLYDEGLLRTIPQHTTINLYLPGDDIKPHIDNKESGDIITILSLLSDAEMIISNEDLVKPIFLPRKSLIQLALDARWNYKHSIKPVKEKRYSIVFRD